MLWGPRACEGMTLVLGGGWSTGVWLGRNGGGIIHQVFANGKVHGMRGVQGQPRDTR